MPVLESKEADSGQEELDSNSWLYFTCLSGIIFTQWCRPRSIFRARISSIIWRSWQTEWADVWKDGQPLILSCPSHHLCGDHSSSLRCRMVMWPPPCKQPVLLQILWQRMLTSFVLCSKAPTAKAARCLFARLIYGQNYPLVCLGHDSGQ